MVDITTERLCMTPVGNNHLDAFRRLHGDARVVGGMKHGVLDAAGVEALYAEYRAGWQAHGIGIWSVLRLSDEFYLGIAGLWMREDGQGWALRYAIDPDHRGLGFAREAAGAALDHALRVHGLARVVAVTRDVNEASRRVLEGIGMVRESNCLDGVAGRLLYANRHKS